MTQAVIYTRVSSDPLGRGRSVAEQETECRASCERNGWDVLEVLVDNDASGSRFGRKDRPEYRRLREVLQPGVVLVTWAASRAQRDLKAYVELRDICDSRGVQWHYNGTTYDLSKGKDRFHTGLDALVAELEVDNNREAVLRAHRANALAGRPHGAVAYGYRQAFDPDTGAKHRVIDEDQAKIVREAIDRIIAGETAFAIAKDFNARGVPTNGKTDTWRPWPLVQMIRRPVYAGLRSHHGALQPAVWEPIITEERHQELLAVLASPDRRAGQPRGDGPVYLLSGLARCGVCGDRLSVKWANGARSYRCAENYCTTRRMDRVDELVSDAVIAWCETTTVPDDSTDPDAAEAIREARELRARLDAAADKYADDEISITALSRIEAKLEPRIKDAERRARRAFKSPHVAELLGKNARATWENMSMTGRRSVVRSLISVTINPAPRGPIFRPEYIRVEWI